MIALLAVAGCGTGAAGTANRKPAAANTSPGPPSGTDGAGSAPASPAPTITTPTITTPTITSPTITSPTITSPTITTPTITTPTITTLTVTTLTTAPPPAASPPSTTPLATGPLPSTAPAAPPTDLAGEVHGFITAVDVPGGTLTLDKIDWFTGAAARQACAEDGVTGTSNNWCTGYYWRNRNPALRTVAVDPDATITVLDGSASVPGSPARVAERITQASSTYLLVSGTAG